MSPAVSASYRRRSYAPSPATPAFSRAPSMYNGYAPPSSARASGSPGRERRERGMSASLALSPPPQSAEPLRPADSVSNAGDAETREGKPVTQMYGSSRGALDSLDRIARCAPRATTRYLGFDSLTR